MDESDPDIYFGSIHSSEDFLMILLCLAHLSLSQPSTSLFHHAKLLEVFECRLSSVRLGFVVVSFASCAAVRRLRLGFFFVSFACCCCCEEIG